MAEAVSPETIVASPIVDPVLSTTLDSPPAGADLLARRSRSADSTRRSRRRIRKPADNELIAPEDLGFDPDSEDDEDFALEEGGESEELEEDDQEEMEEEKEAELLPMVLQEDVERLSQALKEDPGLLLKVDMVRRTLVHLALLRSRARALEAMLKVQDTEILAEALAKPFLGAGPEHPESLPPLHLALNGIHHQRDAAIECLQLLLQHPKVDAAATDGSGRSCLHLACREGSEEAIVLLLEHRADPGLEDHDGLTPLHLAVDSRSQPCLKRILGVTPPWQKAKPAAEDAKRAGPLHPLKRCIERQAWTSAVRIMQHQFTTTPDDWEHLSKAAADRGVAAEWDFVRARGGDASVIVEELHWPAEIFSSLPSAVVSHPLCLQHGCIPMDDDDPYLRSKLIVTTPENPHRLEVLCSDRGVLRSDLFKGLVWEMDPPPASLVDVLRVHEFWYVERVRQQALQVKANSAEHNLPFLRDKLDRGDTKITSQSWDAALRACGAVINAVDKVCRGEVRNAFCAVRPPGHHIGPTGACTNEDLLDDPEGSQGFCILNNVAVGAAYSRCIYREKIRRVAIVDFDVHHGNGTEAMVRNLKTRNSSITSLPTCKPWLDTESDVENVFFASVHAFDGRFYPGTGATSSTARPRIVNVALKVNATSGDLRDAFRRSILPALQDFAPDLLFISAGFDGHEDDLIGRCRFTTEDYIWATQQLMAVANKCCQGRLVSVLEGGYNTRAEALSPFAQSVAGHVHTLMHTSKAFTLIEAPGSPGKKRKRSSGAKAEENHSEPTETHLGELEQQPSSIDGGEPE